MIRASSEFPWNVAKVLLRCLQNAALATLGPYQLQASEQPPFDSCLGSSEQHIRGWVSALWHQLCRLWHHASHL